MATEVEPQDRIIMISKEKIQQAANEYVGHQPEIGEDLIEYSMRDAFKSGIEWFKENLWHDASEKPARYDTYLVKTKQGCLDFCHFATEKWHSNDVGTVVEWLDLSDIKERR